MSAQNNAVGSKVNDENVTVTGEKEMTSDPLEEVKRVSEYPEGGFEAWLVVFGSWCGLFASLGIMNSLGTLQAYLSKNQLASYSDGTIGWIFSIYTFMAWFGGIFVGPVFDKYGPRWLVLAGSIAVVVSLMLLGNCSVYWHFVLDFGILAGLGSALLFTPSIAAVAHFFDARRGTATGIACSGGSIGGIVFPFMFQQLVSTLGFSWSSRIVGFVSMILCGIANLLIRSRLPPAANTNAYPDFRIFKSIPFSLTTAGIFLIEWGLFIPLTYISSYALNQGFSQSFAFEILPIMNAANLFGRILPGFFADRIGRYNTIILSVILNAVSVFGIWLPVGGSTAGIVMFVLVFGFASGTNVCLTPVCIGQLCSTEVYGRYYATCYSIVAFGCLSGIPIAGEILSRNGGQYWGLMAFVGASYIGALIALACVRLLRTSWRLNAIY